MAVFDQSKLVAALGSLAVIAKRDRRPFCLNLNLHRPRRDAGHCGTSVRADRRLADGALADDRLDSGWLIDVRHDVPADSGCSLQSEPLAGGQEPADLPPHGPPGPEAAFNPPAPHLRLLVPLGAKK